MNSLSELIPVPLPAGVAAFPSLPSTGFDEGPRMVDILPVRLRPIVQAILNELVDNPSTVLGRYLGQPPG